jgi:hypothetical protein
LRPGAAGALAALFLVALGAGCAPVGASLPPAPVPYGAAIRIEGLPVPLNPADPRQDRIGDFVYAGGLVLTSQQTSRLHGLSDLKVWPDGRMLAMSDQSDQVEGRIVLDAQGRLAGVDDARISTLKDVDGVELYSRGEKEYDSEGVAVLPSGDRLVSFEQHDRILLYPRDGGLPRPVPYPQIAYVYNKGMEALVAAPEAAADAYRVGIEASGQTFLCRLSAGCTRAAAVDLEGSALSGMERLPDGATAYLLRSYSPISGNVVRLKIVGRDGRTLDEMEIARPLTVDNLEGVAAVPQHDGQIRFYLISDDNFGTYAGLPTTQRTLLLAFDWRPRKPGR